MTHQLLAILLTQDLLDKNINTLKKNETLLDAGKEADLQANVRKTKCLRMSYRQNAEQNHSIDTVNRLFENVAQFKIWGRKIQTNKNRIKE